MKSADDMTEGESNESKGRFDPERDLLIDVGLTETRVALVENGRLATLIGETPTNASMVGAIMLGRVLRIEPALQAAFVDIGRSRDGYLAVADARSLESDRVFGTSYEALPPIDQVLTEGEVVLVQVTKDAVGDKGPVLSCDIQLPGRFLRFAPFRRGVKVPRSFGDDAARMSIAAQVQSLLINISSVPPRATDRRSDDDGSDGALGRRRGEGGAIVRPAARNAKKDELRQDLDRLRARWIGILKRKEAAESSRRSAPVELWREVGPVSRALRDYIGPKLRSILINDPASFAEARGWLTEFAPHMLDRLERYNGPGQLFDEYRVNDDLDLAMSSRVPLASGGSLVIQETEALTVVDVNSGQYTAARDIERMAVEINLEAAEEVAHQLRLRNIGGIIVVDFISMRASPDRVRVVAALRTALERDPAQSRVLAMSELGLVEMTRKRTGETLRQRLTDDCGACDGEGRIPGLLPVAGDILRLAEGEAARQPGKRLVIFCAPEVASYLEEHGLIAKLSQKTGSPVALHGEPGRSRSMFDVNIGQAPYSPPPPADDDEEEAPAASSRDDDYIFGPPPGRDVPLAAAALVQPEPGPDAKAEKPRKSLLDSLLEIASPGEAEDEPPARIEPKLMREPEVRLESAPAPEQEPVREPEPEPEPELHQASEAVHVPMPSFEPVEVDEAHSQTVHVPPPEPVPELFPLDKLFPAEGEQAPKPDAPKPDAPKPDAPKPDAPKPDAPKPDAPEQAASPSTDGTDAPRDEKPAPGNTQPKAPVDEMNDILNKLLKGL